MNMLAVITFLYADFFGCLSRRLTFLFVDCTGNQLAVITYFYASFFLFIAQGTSWL